MTKIDLINGFLGSGKTTFISRYLPWLVARGEGVAVIENEFGTAGMDTEFFPRRERRYGSCPAAVSAVDKR